MKAIYWEFSALAVLLLTMRETFKKHIALQVRDGFSSFWRSNRLEASPLRHYLLADDPPRLGSKEVYNDGLWRQDIINDYLSTDLQ